MHIKFEERGKIKKRYCHDKTSYIILINYTLNFRLNSALFRFYDRIKTEPNNILTETTITPIDPTFKTEFSPNLRISRNRRYSSCVSSSKSPYTPIRRALCWHRITQSISNPKQRVALINL